MYEKHAEYIKNSREFYVGLITESLKTDKEIRFVEEEVIIRIIMRNMTDFWNNPRLRVEDYAQDMWVDKIEYIDEDSFCICATDAEPGFLFNPDRIGIVPRRLPTPLRKIIVHSYDGQLAPYIATFYLFMIVAALVTRELPKKLRPEVRYRDLYDPAVIEGFKVAAIQAVEDRGQETEQEQKLS